MATIGSVDENALAAVEARLGEVFPFSIRRMALPEPSYAFDAARDQYSSTAILSALAAACPPDAARLLGVTERDLFIPMLTFVFGQAQLNGRVALVSLARLRQEFYGFPPEPGLLGGRARKEALHELGHTFGLVHCPDSGCAMALSTNTARLDAKQDEYCGTCSAALRSAWSHPAGASGENETKS